MLTLLTVEECSMFGCPLILGFTIYVIVMIFTCCCCYPGSCLCGQEQLDEGRKFFFNDRKNNPPFWKLHKLNLLGSVGLILEEEMPEDMVKYNRDDVIPIKPSITDSAWEEPPLRKRNPKSIKY